MGQAAQPLKMTPEEYLAFERASEDKHEYVDGEIFAMAGSSREHSLIASNALGELRSALRGRGCEVHGSDLKIKAAKGTRYHYPDALVACGPLHLEGEARDVLVNPKLVVEVLSDSTERYDRGDKFDSYRSVESLTDYVLCSQKRVRVEHYHRAADGSWIFRVLGPGEKLVLDSLGCAIPVDEIYLGVFGEA
jgi:Uma2 family endonuclease